MNVGQIVILTLGAIFVNNFVLARFLGICPFIGVSKRSSDALGMGGAVLFVMLLSAAATWPIEMYVLVPWKLEYLRTVVFILVIASLVQFVEIVLQRFVPALHKSLGIYLPLITTNCAILGVCIINIQMFNVHDPSNALSGGMAFLSTLCHSAGAAIGFTIALLLMAGIRERLEGADVPPSLKGAPIAFITAGLMAIAFMGFSGML